MTGEDLGYKPSVAEEAKIDYPLLGKISNQGLTEEDKNEGLWKSVKNIGDKNEELLKAFSVSNKVSKAVKTFKYDSYRFYRDSEKLKRMV